MQFWKLRAKKVFYYTSQNNMPRKPKRNAGLLVHCAKKNKQILICHHPPQDEAEEIPKKGPGRPRKVDNENKTVTTPQPTTDDDDDFETPGNKDDD